MMFSTDIIQKIPEYYKGSDYEKLLKCFHQIVQLFEAPLKALRVYNIEDMDRYFLELEALLWGVPEHFSDEGIISSVQSLNRALFFPTTDATLYNLARMFFSQNEVRIIEGQGEIEVEFLLLGNSPLSYVDVNGEEGDIEFIDIETGESGDLYVQSYNDYFEPDLINDFVTSGVKVNFQSLESTFYDLEYIDIDSSEDGLVAFKDIDLHDEGTLSVLMSTNKEENPKGVYL